MIRKLRTYIRYALLAAAFSAICPAQAPIHYEPTLDSLNRHPLPEWYAKAKFGIFVCWGP
jgi:alpha-L-fucosidase